MYVNKGTRRDAEYYACNSCDRDKRTTRRSGLQGGPTRETRDSIDNGTRGSIRGGPGRKEPGL